jgi:FdhE protein
MPIVLLAAASSESRPAAAAARWDAILASRPDLEPAVALQRRLLGIVLELAESLDQRPRPRLSLPPRYLAAKLTHGTPVLTGEPIPLPVNLIQPAMFALCSALSEGGAGEAADHIRNLVADGQMDAMSLLTASLTRDQNAIRTGAVHRGVAPDLLWLVSELAVSPFVHLLQRTLFTSDDAALQAALKEWNHGYCAACGSWPALAEVVGGHRVLRCSFCALAWELNVYACVYCGEEGEPFVTAAPDAERPDRRVEVCSSCAGYLKTIDLPVLSPFPLLAIADLETMDVDVVAMEHNYSRPPMKEFVVRR